jgi:hypothetical protein
MCDHLLEHGLSVQGKLHFIYTIDHPKAHLTAPWISGLTQAVAASLFLRTWKLTGNSEYLEAARRCALPLTLSVADGGVLDTNNDGDIWIEEYPGTTATHVLNGCLFGLIALIECKLSGLDEFQAAARQLTDNVVKSFARYRQGRYLFYDLLRAQYCSPHYMGLHTLLYYHLWQLSGDDRCFQIARDLHKDTNWKLYMHSIGRQDGGAEKDWRTRHLD